MQGPKTHDLQVKIIERKEGLAPRTPAERGEADGHRFDVPPSTGATDKDSGAFPDLSVTHKEERGHNKHNHGGQEGHKRQKHSPAEEKS